MHSTVMEQKKTMTAVIMTMISIFLIIINIHTPLSPASLPLSFLFICVLLNHSAHASPHNYNHLKIILWCAHKTKHKLLGVRARSRILVQCATQTAQLSKAASFVCVQTHFTPTSKQTNVTVSGFGSSPLYTTYSNTHEHYGAYYWPSRHVCTTQHYFPVNCYFMNTHGPKQEKDKGIYKAKSLNG